MAFVFRTLLLLALFGASACSPAQTVLDARAKLDRECIVSPDCGPGMGTCYYDKAADALVCLCDHGCRYTPAE